MLREGQVIWFKFRFNNRPGDVSDSVHPYIVIDIDEILETVEIVQLDSIDAKLHKAYLKENKFVSASDEAVLDKDGFAQLDNCFKVENSADLDQYRRTEETLSKEVFRELKQEYMSYQMQNYISENKTVYLSAKEVNKINE